MKANDSPLSQELSHIFDQLNDAIAVFEPVDKIQVGAGDYFLRYTNKSFDEITDFNSKLYFGKTLTEIHAQGPPIIAIILDRSQLDQVFQSTRRTEFELNDSLLRARYIFSLAPLNGLITVSLQKQDTPKAELIQDTSTQQFSETLLNFSPDVIYIYNIQTQKNVYSNNRIKDLLGYTQKEILSLGDRLIPELMHPDDFEVYRAFTLKSYAKALDKEVITQSYRMRHKNGEWHWLESRELIYTRDADNKPVQIFGVMKDITLEKISEQKVFRSQQALMRSEERYRLLFENMTNAFALHEIVTDENEKPVDYVFLEVNPAFERMTGLEKEKILGRRVTAVLPGTENDPADWIGKYGRVALLGETLRLIQYSEALGKWFSVTAYSPQPRQFVVMFTDVTEERLLEERLRQSEKMQAIGQLAGGIAHDFNNQLTSIMGYSELLQMELSSQPELRELIDHVLLASQRAADLTGQLLDYARKGKFENQEVDINALVNEVTQIISHTFDKKIHIKTEIHPGPCTTIGDASQIQNALMNLALNARDAMPQGGTIRLSTAVRELHPEIISELKLDCQPGKYVCVEIEDTGSGMDETTLSHIFEPFFTTKLPGKGTGMGLAAVYGTIKTHEGGLGVSSKPGEGSLFSVFLPFQNALFNQQVESESFFHTQKKYTVLLVDDEDLILGSTGMLLRHLGCTVLTAGSGSQAVEIYRNNKGAIDLVLLDMIMPGLSGAETFNLLKAIDPDIKVLICSGYSREGEIQELSDMGVLGFLHKPFRIEELNRILQDIQLS